MPNPPVPSASSRKSKPFDAVVRAFGLLYNRLPGSYNGLVGALGYRAPQLVADALAEHLTTANPKVLDAGCGTGLTAKAVLERLPGGTMDGFDLSDKMLREAAKTGLYHTLKPADATKALPFETDGYDAAVSSGLYTLGHVGPEALLPVLNTIKPGGLFALNIYDGAWEKMRFEKAIDQLVADGLITVRAHEQATHFGRIGQTCRVIVLDKAT
jgi:predicted TPR repeat methyltransferase